jgi:RNA polymerase sigma-B factor
MREEALPPTVSPAAAVPAAAASLSSPPAVVMPSTPVTESSVSGVAERLLLEYARTGEERVRERIIAMHQSLVRFLAQKFANRGEPLEDLIQVGNIGLVNAVDRFDALRGIKFATFATPTIVGEIRRYFRDKAWSLKVPRRLQELNQAASRAADSLASQLGRPPTVPEIARAIGATEEETLEAIELGNAYETVSLDARPEEDGESPTSYSDILGTEDEGLSALQKHGDLVAALESLDERESAIIRLRFFQDLSQTEVAQRLNISQMHVSRLQRRALDNLKRLLAGQG